MGLLTGGFSLIGIKDGEDAVYKRIDCNLSAISMDSNNVQKEVAVFTLVDTVGISNKPFLAYLKLLIIAKGVVLATVESNVLRSELSYRLPVDNYGLATTVTVEAYEDVSYSKKLCSLSVNIVRENPVPFPRSEAWTIDLKFQNGEYIMVDNIIYMWKNPVIGNSLVSPEFDILNNPETTSWIAYQNWPLLSTQILMANFAKLGSAVFLGDYMFSQHGKDAAGNATADYRKFNPIRIGQDNTLFTPNLMLDLLKGEFRLGDKFVASIKDGKLDIVMQGKLQTSATGERIVLDPDDKSIILYDSNGLKSIELFIGNNGNGVVRSYSRDYNNGVRQTATLSDGQLVIDDGVQSVYPSIGNNSFAIFPNGFRLNDQIEQRFDVFNTVSHDGSNKRIVEVLSSAWPTSASQVLPGGIYIENYFLKVRPGW